MCRFANVSALFEIRQVVATVAVVSTRAIGPLGRLVGENLLRLRKLAGLSLRELSEALREAGHPVNVDGLNRAEQGKRRVDVEELVAIAVVLGVNPSALLLPPTASGTTTITGAGEVRTGAAWDWLDGRAPLNDSGKDDGTAAVAFQMRARPPDRRRFPTETAAGYAALVAQYEDTPGWTVERDDDGEPVTLTAPDGSVIRAETLRPRRRP